MSWRTFAGSRDASDLRVVLWDAPDLLDFLAWTTMLTATPLVVRWPAVITQTGSLVPDVGHVIDVMPTCLDVAGGEYPTDFNGRKPLPLEGKSLAPILRGESREDHDVLCWNLPQTRAIRMGRWKLVEPGRKQPWELFDLETDGTETRNLAEEYPERARDMVARWQAWAERCGAEQ